MAEATNYHPIEYNHVQCFLSSEPLDASQDGECSSAVAKETMPQAPSWRALSPEPEDVYDAVLPIVSPSASLIISVDWIDYTPVYLGHRHFQEGQIGSFVSSHVGLVRNIGDTIIAINGEDVRGRSLSNVMTMLSQCGEFASLKFRENPSLVNKSQQVVQQRVQAFESVLQTLDFNPNSCKQLLRLLLSSLRYSNSIKHAVEAIHAGLFSHPFLVKQFSSFLPKDLDFSFAACLSSQDITALADTLRYSSHVERLKISCQPVGTANILQIADMLVCNRTLIEVDLGLNHLSDEGTKAISLALEQNHSLQVLVLTGNNFGLEGVKSIAKMLKINRGLKQLNLAFNSITGKKARIIADSLRHNSTLTKINICDINMDKEGSVAFRKCIYDDTSLNTLSDSNHTLTHIESLIDNSNTRYQLNELLALNSLGPEMARKVKLIRYLEKNFRSTLLDPSLDYKFLPHVLSLMGDLDRLPLIFDLLRNIPEIFLDKKSNFSPANRDGRKRKMDEQYSIPRRKLPRLEVATLHSNIPSYIIGAS